MEQTSKMLACLLGGILLVFCTSLITYFIVSYNSPTCDSLKYTNGVNDNNAGLRFTNEGAVDLVQNLRISDKGLSLSKGLAGGRCFVLTNDQNPTHERALSVLNEEMNLDQLEALGGRQAADFCRGLIITPIQHISQDFRARRQAQVAHGPSSGTITNECAQKVIVQCSNDTSVYKCVSGPKEAYRETITCKKANEFTLDLTTRCKEFDNTKTDRLQKCLEKIILNQQGAGGQAPSA